MISIGIPPISSTTPTRKAQEHAHVSDSKQLRESPKRPVADRRKKKDRRHKQRKGQFLELRSGKDRRRSAKSGRRVSIDVTA